MFFLKKKNTPVTDDAELLLLYRNTKDLFYVGELFKKHSKTVLGTCLFYLEDKEEAKDAVMQIFDKLIVELKVQEIDYFKAWLGFVTRNYCISFIRKRKSTQSRMAAYYEFEKQESDYDTEVKIAKVSDDELAEQLLQVSMEELKEQQRNCIVLFYLQNKSYQQISDTTGFSLNEVKSYIQNGKRNLKLLIEEKQTALKKSTKQ